MITKAQHTTEVTGKLELTDALSNLDNFVTVAGAPTITSGMLTATQFSVIRHKAPLLSDYCEISATVGELQSGKSRIMFCGDETFRTWYGLEIEYSLFANNWTFCRSINIRDCYKSAVARATSVNDVAKIRYDKPAGLLRMYRNGTQLSSIPVPPKGLKWWGLATGVDGFFNVGPKFTSVTAKDI